MNKMIVLAFSLLAFTSNVYASDFSAFRSTVKVFVDGSSFYWDEHDQGEKLLEETGPLFGAGASFKGISRGLPGSPADLYRLTYGANLRLFFGRVDYDGQLQNGTPYKTDVDYFGGSIEGQFGLLLKTGVSWWFVEPELKLGYSPWLRDIRGPAGYTEDWQAFYGRAGLGFIFPFKPGYIFKISGGATIPIWVQNSVDVSGYGTVDLQPKAFEVTPYAELTFEYKRFGVSLFYDSFKFGQSDVEWLSPDLGLFQPESHTHSIGVRLTYAVFAF